MQPQQNERLYDCLTLIEQELRALGMWESTPPSEQALSSQQPFCIDTLAFEQWLQWVLLPRVRQLLVLAQPLPKGSAVAPMAEVVYQAQRVRTMGLRKALEHFDWLLESSESGQVAQVKLTK